jgi:hypothetical protein
VVTQPMARYDIAELVEPVDGHPAGERGGVLDIYTDGTALVELTSLPAELGVDRIVVAPLAKLRVVDARSPS